MTVIKFTDTMGVPEEYRPKPADRFIPDWYKTLESYMNNEKKPDGDGNALVTIKKCMPVFDSISAGYIIVSYVDVYVSQKKATQKSISTGEESEITIPWYEWPSFSPIDFHTIEQAPTHPNRNGHNQYYPKWNNAWSIKTPPGYSVLFVQPMHRESPFTILPGVVDTDQYFAPVNFPFVLNDISFEGLIPAGTPIAQVIPFKRESWGMEIGTTQDYEDQRRISSKLRTKFFDSYKSQYRQIKEYK